MGGARGRRKRQIGGGGSVPHLVLRNHARNVLWKRLSLGYRARVQTLGRGKPPRQLCTRGSLAQTAS
eukprot:2840768-Alexandrium_andersonii.AAC.1